MKKIELGSSHDSLTTVCKDGSLRITNLNEHITFGKKLSERMKIPFNPIMEMDVGTYLPSDGKAILNGGLAKGQLSNFTAFPLMPELFPKTNMAMYMAAELIRQGKPVIFISQEPDWDLEGGFSK